ncbi:hypothetical protein HanPSC8_Chr02g0063961 [Helianthus annuus]|nr:hypothetical protein HanPSC8_Chr02g0063961 [Helianthus annuus]
MFFFFDDLLDFFFPVKVIGASASLSLSFSPSSSIEKTLPLGFLFALDDFFFPVNEITGSSSSSSS